MKIYLIKHIGTIKCSALEVVPSTILYPNPNLLFDALPFAVKLSSYEVMKIALKNTVGEISLFGLRSASLEFDGSCFRLI